MEAHTGHTDKTEEQAQLRLLGTPRATQRCSPGCHETLGVRAAGTLGPSTIQTTSGTVPSVEGGRRRALLPQHHRGPQTMSTM